MLAGRLYKKGSDGVLRICVEADEVGDYIVQAHIAVRNIHVAPEQTIRRLDKMGVYWPSYRKDIYQHVRNCSCGQGEVKTMNYLSTLFQINPIAPKWASHIVHLLSTNTFPT